MASEMVEEEASRLRILSDDEIAKHYVNNCTSNYPMIIKSKALDLIMKERGFTVKISMHYEIVRI